VAELLPSELRSEPSARAEAVRDAEQRVIDPSHRVRFTESAFQGRIETIGDELECWWSISSHQNAD